MMFSVIFPVRAATQAQLQKIAGCVWLDPDSHDLLYRLLEGFQHLLYKHACNRHPILRAF